MWEDAVHEGKRAGIGDTRNKSEPGGILPSGAGDTSPPAGGSAGGTNGGDTGAGGPRQNPPAWIGAVNRLRRRIWSLLAGLLVMVVLLTAGTKAVVSYTDRPEFCISCHVMEPQYETWFHSSHRQWASCSDCHVPHQNLAAKLVGKGIDGTRDFYLFYTNQVPDPIHLSDRGGRIVRENCLRCHGDLMENVIDREDRDCWECHRSVPHGQGTRLLIDRPS
ncbi:cytochrome c nitrate reductase, small subunit [Desulfofundulus kuznetsovii DSM 6115]|uniref:Cytochrome c nitrate reductase, small subunit n=1 Tax=Desulfofundulus kuznetsovii (strain DSM 6115 / VKM B-1805 / 17) TaxID=760568 RepID=A0AAU8PDK2_DESK7|nr:cytochrome c nitrate reductase, small subunit [Desulfofundulus kuznetsovii DSM 6115]